MFSMEEEIYWSCTLDQHQPEYCWPPEDFVKALEPNAKVKRLIIKNANLAPEATKDEVVVVQIECQGLNNKKVISPIVAMKGGENGPIYVNLPITGPALIKLVGGQGPIHLTGSHCLDWSKPSECDENEEEMEITKLSESIHENSRADINKMEEKQTEKESEACVKAVLDLICNEVVTHVSLEEPKEIGDGIKEDEDAEKEKKRKSCQDSKFGHKIKENIGGRAKLAKTVNKPDLVHSYLEKQKLRSAPIKSENQNRKVQGSENKKRKSFHDKDIEQNVKENNDGGIKLAKISNKLDLFKSCLEEQIITSTPTKSESEKRKVQGSDKRKGKVNVQENEKATAECEVSKSDAMDNPAQKSCFEKSELWIGQSMENYFSHTEIIKPKMSTLVKADKTKNEKMGKYINLEKISMMIKSSLPLSSAKGGKVKTVLNDKLNRNGDKLEKENETIKEDSIGVDKHLKAPLAVGSKNLKGIEEREKLSEANQRSSLKKGKRVETQSKIGECSVESSRISMKSGSIPKESQMIRGNQDQTTFTKEITCTRKEKLFSKTPEKETPCTREKTLISKTPEEKTTCTHEEKTSEKKTPCTPEEKLLSKTPEKKTPFTHEKKLISKTPEEDTPEEKLLRKISEKETACTRKEKLLSETPEKETVYTGEEKLFGKTPEKKPFGAAKSGKYKTPEKSGISPGAKRAGVTSGRAAKK